MRYYLTLLLFLSQASVLFSQFTDNFTDGNFTAAPAWTGNSIDFTVTSGELQLNAPSVTSTKYLSTSSQAINSAQWEFKTRMTFGTSSSNFAKIYLVSNTSNLSGSLNGYFIKIGGSDDEVSLFSQTGTSTNEIIDGRDGAVGNSTVDVVVRVTRSSAGLWEIFSDTSSTSTFISEGTVTDNSHTQSLFFGVECNFTSTRSDKFFFDDFVVTGTAAVDNIKPTLDSVTIISATQLELVFSEPLDATTSQTVTNYSANNGIGNPTTSTQNPLDFSRVNLSFSTSFGLGIINSLTVSNVTDIASNVIVTTNKNFVYFLPSVPEYRDVVINEIFADPSPIIGLPDGEFIEIYNPTSSSFFELNGWQITDGSSTSTLPSYTLGPDSYVILYASSTSGDFSLYSDKLGLTSFPGLNNAGETLTLLDNNGNIIDAVEYSVTMYNDAVKDDGGYTLEQINPKAKCFNPNNWTGSNNNNGGTPTQLNSIYDTTPDIKNVNLISAFATSNSQIELKFSEPIDTAEFIRNLTISGGRTVVSYSALNDFNTAIELIFSPLLDTGVIYKLAMDSLSDCEGNSTNNEAEVVLAHANKNDAIILNEILFNPIDSEDDFVELYNNSDFYINLKGWSLAQDDNGNPDNLKTITQDYVLKPRDYVVITKDYSITRARYATNAPNKFIELETLPSYSNDDGTVYILSLDGTVSDKFTYSSDFHFALLRDDDGVSLERLDFNTATQDESNWHSAAEEVGFATPGIKNSQFNPAVSTEKFVSVSPELFSPDNDGFEDVLTISYSMNEPGFVGNITIYDANGRLIRTLVQNQLLATEGSFTWDGITNDNLKARIGRYVILFEVYNLDGTVKAEKVSCVVAHRL